MSGKRILCLALACLLCGPALSGLAAEGIVFGGGEGGGEVLACTAGDGESFYALTSEGELQRIYRVTPGETEPTLLYEKATGLAQPGEPGANEAVHLLVGGPGRVYVFNAWSKRLGTVDDSGVAWMDVPLQLPGLGLTAVTTRDFAFATHQDGLLTLALREENHACRFSVVEMGTGVLLEETRLTNAPRVAPYRDGQVVVYRDGSLYAVASRDGSTELLAEGIDVPSGLCYDADSDTLYYAAGGQVWRRPAVGIPEALASIEGGQPDGVLSGLYQNGVYALAHPGWLRLYDIGGGGGSNLGGGTGPILVAIDWLPPAAEAFAAAHPGTPVQQVEPEEDGELLFARIGGGDASPDIYSISVDSGAYRRLKEDGYMAGLSGSPALTEAVGRMYPAVSGLLTNQAGQVAAVPVDITVHGWTVNLELWNQAFPGQALPRTWDAWLTLLEGSQAAQGPKDIAFFRSADVRQELFFEAYQQFIRLSERAGQGVDFSDPALRAVLARIEALPVAEPAGDEDPQNGLSIFTSDSMMLFKDPEEVGLAGDAQRFAPYPIPVFTEDQDPLVPMALQVCFLNPNAAHPEAALSLLEAMLTGADPYLRYALTPTLNDPVPNAAYEADLQELRNYLTQLEEAKAAAPQDQQAEIDAAIAEQQHFLAYYEQAGLWTLSQGAIDAYRQDIGPYLYSDAGSLFLGYDGQSSAQDQLNDILGRYLDGQISLDEMLAALAAQAGEMK